MGVARLDNEALWALWERSWPAFRPIGHELRQDEHRWVRFHALPLSKRYPETDAEYTEVLRRHNQLLQELTRHTGPELLVMTMAWSESDTPPARAPELVQAVSSAEFWMSVLVDEDDESQQWTHVFVTRCSWYVGVLDALLRLVADDRTRDVIISDEKLRWLTHPYDGGVDVVTADPRDRDQLKAVHRDWLSSHPRGL